MTRSPIVETSTTAVRLACLALVASLAGCSALDNLFSTDKVDYKTNARQTGGLEVPPDLTQLARDSRSQIQGGSVSASALQQQQEQQQAAAGGNRPAATAGSGRNVALSSAGEVQIERIGNTRYLHTTQTPEQVWPQMLAFWKENGFDLVTNQADIGVMETNYVENRSKIPQDILRKTLGRLIDGLYSSGERDMYRARVERNEKGGTDIFVSHHGKTEVYTDSQKTGTAWQDRPADPLLEGEMLSRLMLKLGGKAEAAPTQVATANTAAAAPAAPVPASTLPDARKARPLSEVPDQIVVNEQFERAWRRVGQSLDRHGFTIEDRDRTMGLFFLRYADPSQAGKEEPNFFQRLFSSDKGAEPIRYRVSVKAQGQTSVVSILDNKGQPQTNNIAKGILNLLMDDLR